MKTNKFLAVIFAVFMIMTLAPKAMAFEYKDVPSGSADFYPVDYLRRNDVFKDTPYFYPNALISKAEFIKYLVLLNSPDYKSPAKVELPFEDTKNDAWYSGYFKEAIKLGILDDREKKVEPNKKLTVVDALTLLFHSQSIPIPNVYKGSIPYTDVVRNSSAAPLVMRALSLNIIMPQRNDFVGIYQRVTRAQAARMIYKMDLVTLGSATSNGLPQIDNYTPELNKIITVWQLMESSYINRDKIDKKALSDTVLKDLVDQLGDPYSVYMNEQENNTFLDSLDGQVEGIGAVVGYNDKKEIVIVSPLKGGPAEKAGIMSRDVILEVDDNSMSGKTLEEAVSAIKGPKGTTVKIKVSRSSGIKTFTIVRELINVPSVTSETIDNGRIMRLDLSQFNFDANEEFSKALQNMQADKNIKGLIIDLRDDPGGLLDIAISVLGHFVKAQEELVTINYADYSQVLLSSGKAELEHFPIVILINGGSASASEIVAGAMQDYGLATIVGETSFGKGTVQEVNYFNDSSSVKLTVAKWLTPKHQSIQDGGIDPDVKVADDPLTTADEQLATAITELNKLIR
jgi:carboxyl-terminal processing protease